MGRSGTMLGLFMLRTEGEAPAGGPVMARIEGELYALCFSNAQRAIGARANFGVDAQPFYVCAANTQQVLDELREAGARGFILDYDPHSATFSSAGALPVAA